MGGELMDVSFGDMCRVAELVLVCGALLRNAPRLCKSSLALYTEPACPRGCAGHHV